MCVSTKSVILDPFTTYLLCQVRVSGWRRTLQAIGRLTIGTVIVAGVGFYYVAHQERTPGTQLPRDPTKKTLVVLGSGWGATSFLKKLDTTDYNVVSTFVQSFRSAVSPELRWLSAPTIISFSPLCSPVCPQAPSPQNQSFRVSIVSAPSFSCNP